MKTSYKQTKKDKKGWKSQKSNDEQSGGLISYYLCRKTNMDKNLQYKELRLIKRH